MTDPLSVEAGVAADGGLVADDRALANAVAALGATVGVDTEFMRVRTYHPIPALYQLGGNAGVTLVDAQAPASFSALTGLLADAERTKVMHACSEDFEVIARQFDLRPANVVDTQIAHAFLTPRFSVSYAELVEHHLGITLQKHETRSDWLQRPLTREQLAYAREDAAHLLPVWERQRDALAAKGRLPWLTDEMRQLLAKPTPTPETCYQSFKGLGRLTRRQLAVLRQLAAWREHHAQGRDLPRAWIARDDVLLAMAQREVLTADDLAQLLPERAARRFAPAVLAAHRKGLADEHPPEPAPKPLPRAANDVLKELRGVVQAAAERLGMAPELLGRRRDLVAAYRAFGERRALPAQFDGWRADILGAELQAVLERRL